MRILTYNIHGWHTQHGAPNLAMVGDVIAATEADVIGLNEVFYPRALADTTIPALEQLAERLEMHFVFGACLRWPVQDQMPADAYGNAILSRWPILASANHHLTPKDEDQQALLATKEQRGLLEARILRPDNSTLTVYVTHLDHTDEAARLLQLRVARQWLVRDRNRAHLLMGDFNAISPWDYTDRQEVYRQLTTDDKGQNLVNEESGPQVITQMEKSGYVDLLRQLSHSGQQSYISATNDNIRIDYIFASKALASQAHSCQIWYEELGMEASDHRPVLAELHG